MPPALVIRISFSALSARASAPARRSESMWYAVPSSATPSGQDHRHERFDSSRWTSSVSMPATSPTKPDVDAVARAMRHRADEAAVLPVDAHRAPAVPVDQPGQLLVDLVERHLDDGERLRVGHAHAVVAARRHSHRREQLVDAPAAAVHDDRLHADQPQQRHVAREVLLERRVGHRASAEAHDDRLAVVGAQVRERLGERVGDGGGVGHVRMVPNVGAAPGGAPRSSGRRRRRRALS
jgi:hypothetical protein